MPSTACSLAGTVVDLDTNDELGWWAPCLRLGWLHRSRPVATS